MIGSFQELKLTMPAGDIGEPILFQAWLGFPPIDSPHRYDPALGGGALLDAELISFTGRGGSSGQNPPFSLRSWKRAIKK